MPYKIDINRCVYDVSSHLYEGILLHEDWWVLLGFLSMAYNIGQHH